MTEQPQDTPAFDEPEGEPEPRPDEEQEPTGDPSTAPEEPSAGPGPPGNPPTDQEAVEKGEDQLGGVTGH